MRWPFRRLWRISVLISRCKLIDSVCALHSILGGCTELFFSTTNTELRPPYGLGVDLTARGSFTHLPSTTYWYSYSPGGNDNFFVHRPPPAGTIVVRFGLQPLNVPAMQTTRAFLS